MKTYQFWYKVVLGVISFGVIAFVYKTPLVDLCFIILGFIVMLIGLKALLSYAKPTQKLFRYRFLCYGLAETTYSGFLVIYIVSNSEKYNPWIWVLYLIFLALFIAFAEWRSFQKTKKQLKIKLHLKSEIYDSVSVRDSKNQVFHGRLFFTENTISFCSRQGEKIFTEIDVSAAEPKLIRNKTFHFPVGIYFPHHEIKIYVNFPLFWLKTIQQKELHALIA